MKLKSHFFSNFLIDIKYHEIMAKDKEINDKTIAKERRGFYIHFIIYIIVNIGLYGQWWYITEGKES